MAVKVCSSHISLCFGQTADLTRQKPFVTQDGVHWLARHAGIHDKFYDKILKELNDT